MANTTNPPATAGVPPSDAAAVPERVSRSRRAEGKPWLAGAAPAVALCVAVAAVAWPMATKQPAAHGTHEAQRRDAAPAFADAADESDNASSLVSDEALDLAACTTQQRELTYLPAVWPGVHPLCLVSGTPGGAVEVQALVRATGALERVAAPSVDALIDALRPLLTSDYGDDDPTVVAADYDFPPHDWRLFTHHGEPVTDADAAAHAPGRLVLAYEGGQFIWPGWRLGHTTRVRVPLVDDSTGAESFREVEMTTASLRPLVFELEQFLTDAECEYIKSYAEKRLVPSRLAHMDSSTGNEAGVRTSTQVFMPRGGSDTILHLEHRAHNLTRLPYHLGENIQVLRYEPGQKYGAHRDYFSANDYHQQPSMLKSVEYGARNRLATVFWYVTTVDEGGETYFPRALDAHGQEYNPWNGDHDDCYRGIAVKPKKGNAVLFYGMLPNGHLDERSLHGGCPPRNTGANSVKWGANQWIWNQPRRFPGQAFPRKAPKSMGVPGCRDESEHCRTWASQGECARNSAYMHTSCPASCNTCNSGTSSSRS